jgi:lipopolysaccharide transport system permease protein
MESLTSNLETGGSEADPGYEYELRIRPNRGWIAIDWRELWHYRDLLLLLVRRDFVARYAQSVLGPAWFVIQPLLTTVVFTIVFSGIAKIPTSGVPPLLFYLCNQVAWLYFSNCFNSTSATLSLNHHLFSKVYFPRLIAPLSTLLSNGFTLVVQLGTFFAVFAWFKLSGSGDSFCLSPWLIALPLMIVQLAMLAAGFGFWMAALNAKYRDLSQLSGVLVQLWMYATPVIYPLAQVPEEWRWLVALNPVSFPVEMFRLALLGTGAVTLQFAFTSVAITIVMLATGLAIFNKTEKSYVDIA